MTLGGGRSLRRQIEAALSGEADPLGEEGLGPRDRPTKGAAGEFDLGSDAATEGAAEPERSAGAPVRRGKRGKERHVDAAVREAYEAAQVARAAAERQVAAATGSGAGTATPGRRLPDLHPLPKLLHGSGAFATLRARLGSEAGPIPASGRHASLAAVPHGAKTFLAAALAMDVVGESGGKTAGPAASRRRWNRCPKRGSIRAWKTVNTAS